MGKDYQDQDRCGKRARSNEGGKADRQFLEAAVDLYTEDAEMLDLLKEYESDFPMIFIVSDVTRSNEPLDSANNGEIFDKLFIKTRVADSNKCDQMLELP